MLSWSYLFAQDTICLLTCQLTEFGILIQHKRWIWTLQAFRNNLYLQSFFWFLTFFTFAQLCFRLEIKYSNMKMKCIICAISTDTFQFNLNFIHTATCLQNLQIVRLRTYVKDFRYTILIILNVFLRTTV